MKILLVEDDLSTSQFLVASLKAHRYTIDVATDGRIGLDLAEQSVYDVILLDIILPHLDGISLCRRLRQQGCQTPILMLTAQNSNEDVVIGLEAGADDYVIKPCEPSQLIARIQALCRRRGAIPSSSILTWGALSFNPTLIQVTYQETIISLSPKEYSLLELFLRHPQRIFSRSSIIDHIWSIDDFPSDAAVTNLIKDLRRKLKTVGMNEELIDTVYRIGYRLKTPPKKNSNSEGIALIEQVKLEFQNSIAERIENLERALQDFPSQQDKAREEAHRLVGGLGTFGYPECSRIARSLEHLLGETHFTKQKYTQIEQLMAQLKKEVFQEPIPLMVKQEQVLSIPLVWVIDEDCSMTESLQQLTLVQKLRIEKLDTLAQQTPSIILHYLNQTPIQEDRLALLKKLKTQFPTVPILTLAQTDDLESRITIARFGGERYILQPKTPDETLAIIWQILPKSRSNQAKVMVVDDDPIMLKTLSALLQPWDLEVIALQDPEQFWQTLTQTEPDVLLLDLEMPNYSGIELCQVVRQEPKYDDLPILMVTAHTQQAEIEQVFAAGADDFISKPVAGPELVSRVIHRLERSQMQQQLLKLQLGQHQSKFSIDPLTQLASHSYFREYLEQEWQRLTHEQAFLSVIVCDVDYFNAYHQSLGYQAGNECLQQIATTIQNHVQSDCGIVARYGADEFGIILPRTGLERTLQIVESICKALIEQPILHPASPICPYLTMSFGITGTIPIEGKSTQDLITSVEEALHAAQARGHNTFCLYPL